MRGMRALGIGSLVLAAMLLMVLPVSAGLYFEQSVTTEGHGRGMEMKIKGWAESGKAKILYEDSNNPILHKGDYLLTLDGGKTVYLIDPEKKTYSKWSMEELFAFMNRLGQSTGGMVKIDFQDPHSQTLVTEPGGTVLGHSTTHYKWKSGFTMDMKVAFMHTRDRLDTVTDAWVTKDVFDPGLFSWLRATVPTTGDPDLDKILKTNTRVMGHGLLLKMNQTTITTNKKGKQRTSTTHFEVTKLVQENVDDSIFAMPSGYSEAPLIPEMGASPDQGDNGKGHGSQDEEHKSPMSSLKSLFGKKH
jgi:Domain of unknown function (DUF4412)